MTVEGMETGKGAGEGAAPDVRAARAAAAVAALRDGRDGSLLHRAAGRIDALFHADRPELIDLSSTPESVRQHIIQDVDLLNCRFGLYRMVLRRLAPLLRAAARRHPARPVRVIDVGTGHGGLLFAIDGWARRNRVKVELAGCDLSPALVEATRRAAAERGVRLELFVGDARKLDEIEDGEFDVALFVQTLHHLPAADAARALLELDRVSSESFFLADVARSLAAVPVFWLALRATVWAPTRHDGMTSLRRAYTPSELRTLAAAAGVPIQVDGPRPGLMIATRPGAAS